MLEQVNSLSLQPLMLNPDSEDLVSCWYKAFSAGRSFCDKDQLAEQLVAFLKALQKLLLPIHVVASLPNFHLPPKDGCKCSSSNSYTDQHGKGLCSDTHCGCLKVEVLCTKECKCLCPCQGAACLGWCCSNSAKADIKLKANCQLSINTKNIEEEMKKKARGDKGKSESRISAKDKALDDLDVMQKRLLI